MKKYCKVAPDKGFEQFMLLKKQLGYNRATSLWNNVVTHQDFLEDYKDTLTLDGEGIPTFESLMSNPYIKQILGQEDTKRALQGKYKPRENTRTNFQAALGEALEFNKNNPNNNDFIAIIDLDNSNDTIQVKIVDNNNANRTTFQQQFGLNLLNKRISELLRDVGISEGIISQSGINGITDFSKAERLANDLIAVSNNIQGERALSEEFAHLCLEVFKDNPLVTRAKNSLTDEDVIHTLGDSYESYNTRYNGDVDKLKEEALGHMLQESFFNNRSVPKKSKTLFSRLVSRIKNLFSKFNSNALRDSIIDSKTAMDNLARDILKGDIELTKTKIRAIKRTDELYNLEEQVNTTISILSDAVDLETKMLKIQKNEDRSFVEEMLLRMDDADTALGICRYLEHTIDSLGVLVQEASNVASADPRIKFGWLRKANNYINMYGGTLSRLNRLLASSVGDDDLQLLSRGFEVQGVTDVTIRQLVDTAVGLSNQLAGFYMEYAEPAFVSFIKPFMGNNTINPFKANSEVLTVESLVKKADSDISWTDKWLSSMSESSDALLQLFDQATKKAKDKARMRTIFKGKDIMSAYNKARNAGITDFKFIYKYDENGNRTNQYISTAEEIDALTDAQKEFYNTYMSVKRELDDLLDDKRASSTHVIQIKKDHSFGALGLLAQGKFNEVGEYFRDKVFERSYDDAAGYSSRNTLKGFDNKEYMLVPKYYLHDLDDQNEVSDDPISALIAYAHMAYNYKEMDDIVDALETGRNILKSRKVAETRGSKRVKETFEWAGVTVESDVELEWDKTNIAQKLDRFFNSQVYGRYIEDQGVWTVAGKQVSIQKLTSTILGASSHVQLGFNWLANSANIANGIAMTNIEAAAGRYFKAKTLLKADGIYSSLLGDYVLELHNPIKTNKLALIEEYFDTRQDANERFKGRFDKAMLTKIFGPNLAFIGQSAGDHWLYNRVALAYMLETPAYYTDANGNEVKSNVYEALDVVIDDNGVGRLQIKQGWRVPDAKNNVFTDISRKVANINQKLFGVYNQDDQVAAQQVAVGRLALQYRKWLMPAISKRFQAAQYNATLDEWNEGYYRTAARFFIEETYKELKRGEFQLLARWNDLENHPEVKENITRALYEVGQYLGVLAAIWLIGIAWPDKKERPWLVKFLDYQLKRQRTELGVLIPNTRMAHEAMNIINAPAAGVSYIDNALGIVDALLDPTGWSHIRTSGPYEGMNDFEVAVYKNTPYIKGVKRSTSDIDTALQYFNK